MGKVGIMSHTGSVDRSSVRAAPMRLLLYRYLWPFQYFRDVTRGTRIERQQNYRHNRSMRVFLPGFICKWVVLSALCFALGSLCDHSLELTIAAAACYITSTLTIIVAVKLGAAWLWLERFPELY